MRCWRLTSTGRKFPGGGGCLPWTGGSPGVWTGSTTRWTASGSTPSSGARRRRSSSSLTGRPRSERLCRRKVCWCSRLGRAGPRSVSSWAGRSPALPSPALTTPASSGQDMWGNQTTTEHSHHYHHSPLHPQAQARHLHRGRLHPADCCRADCGVGRLSLIIIMMMLDFFFNKNIRHCFLQR